ncbi:MAG: rod shape-determining protein RodA [Chloroflexi bacterium]|nr:rod shape-determining protein RodA [Chloroflexota bacterium]
MIGRAFRGFDVPLLLAVALLSGIGVLMISSATSNSPGLEGYALRQIIYTVVGLVLMLVMTAIDYRVIASLRWPILILTLIMLAVIFALGYASHGSQRWFDLGFFNLQPSEITKVAFVIVLASFLGSRGEQMGRLSTLTISLVLLALPTALIYLQPDLGTALVLVWVWAVMIFTAGVSTLYLGLMGLGGLAALPFVWTRLQGYMQRRLLTFLNPQSDPSGYYNIQQALVAIGSGSLFGKGFRLGSQSQLHYLRIRHTDFLFSVIGEELGLVGCLLIIGLLGFILWRLLRAAELARDPLGRFIAVGLAAILFFQSVVNIGVNLGVMPVTGIPLPFVSFGGSAHITFWMAIGLVQSVLLRHKKIDF